MPATLTPSLPLAGSSPVADEGRSQPAPDRAGQGAGGLGQAEPSSRPGASGGHADLEGLERPTAVSTGMELLPLIPQDMHVLRHGPKLSSHQRLRRHRVLGDDGLRHWDGTSYEHESSRGIVQSLASRMKTQGVWDADEAFRQLMSPDNRGGRWLREQGSSARAVFENLWSHAYQHTPRLSLQQLTEVLLVAMVNKPGVAFAELRQLGAGHGHGHQGRLSDLLDGLVAKGEVRQERTYGPSGKCISRRFWFLARQAVETVAKVVAVSVSLCLTALEGADLAVGHRTPGGSRSYLRLLTDKKLRARGLRLLRQRLGRQRTLLRAQKRMVRDAAAVRVERVLVQSELDYLLAGLDLVDRDELPATTDSKPTVTASGSPVLMGRAPAWLPCVA